MEDRICYGDRHGATFCTYNQRPDKNTELRQTQFCSVPVDRRWYELANSVLSKMHTREPVAGMGGSMYGFLTRLIVMSWLTVTSCWVIGTASAGAAAQSNPVPTLTPAASALPTSYRLETDVSMRSIPVDVRFSGARIVMFGSASRQGAAPVNAGPLDIVAVVQGARVPMRVHRKSNVWGVWVNTRSVAFEQAPRYYAVASTRPLEAIAATPILAATGIGFEQLPISTTWGEAIGVLPSLIDEFRAAAIETGIRKKHYVRQDGGIEFVGTSLFRGQIDLPANIPIGQLDVSVFLFRNGQVVARHDSAVTLAREGFEHVVYEFAHNYSLLYGVFTVALACCVGLASSFLVGLRRR